MFKGCGLVSNVSNEAGWASQELLDISGLFSLLLHVFILRVKTKNKKNPHNLKNEIEPLVSHCTTVVRDSKKKEPYEDLPLRI